MIRRPAPLLALPLLLCTLTACGGEAPARVVLITLDTLRYDGLVPREGELSPMPATWARAGRGLLFERFYASTSVTQPSHASKLTALHPWEHGVVSNGQILEERFVTVAELLAAEGFATEAVVASFPVAGRFGFAQGFDRFDDLFVEGADDPEERRWEGHTVPGGAFYSLGGHVTERALARIDAAGARRQFFWFHYFDPHDPYGDAAGEERLSPTRAFTLLERGRDVSALLERFRTLYDRDLAALDRALDRLLARLEADADEIPTHVVLTSDHGESFGEAGAIAHGMRLTPEQIRVPLVILSPRVEAARRDDVASSVDVARTLLSLAGVDLPGGAAGAAWRRARDLTAPPGGRTGAVGMRRTFWSDSMVELRADGSRHPLDQHLFYAVDREGRLVRGNGEELLDPATEGASPERLRELFAGFERALAAGVAPAAGDPEAREALRALGYVQ